MTATGYTITADPAAVEFEVVYAFLSESYWAKGIPRETLRRALANSVCFTALASGAQVGFARVITDRATFAYLADVFVLPAHRGRGIAKAMMDEIVKHPDLQRLRRWVLVTRDAHGLYARYGFQPLKGPAGYMESWDQDVYARPSEPGAR